MRDRAADEWGAQILGYVLTQMSGKSFIAGSTGGWYAGSSSLLSCFGTATRLLQHEDSFPHRVSWFPVHGPRPFARAGVLRGFAGVPDGDSGRGWNCRRGPLCALALAIIQ